jgi:DNA-binding MarR family transcriptional regulator
MQDKKRGARELHKIVDIDRVVHEPARLLILSYLYVVESADFLFLLRQTNLTKGNLSSHLMKLEKAGYVNVEKRFVQKIPRTLLSLTKEGRKAFHEYSQRMKRIIKTLPD